MQEKINLTPNEIAILRGAQDNDFMNCFEPGDAMSWTFAVIDASGLDPKIARGVISSLVKKGFVSADDSRTPVNDRCFSVHEEFRSQLAKMIKEW